MKILKKIRPKKNKIPGSIEFTGNQKLEKSKIEYLAYNLNEIEQRSIDSFDSVNIAPKLEGFTQWLDIRGIHDTELLNKIGEAFTVHPLILEDVADVDQRPKLTEYDNGLSFLIHAVYWNSVNAQLEYENVSIFLSDGMVISFQEDLFDQFEEVKNRINNKLGRIRKRNTDYLAYSLIDCLIDRYFEALEPLNNLIHEVEMDIVEKKANNIRSRILELKREMITLRKSVMPMRDAISSFLKSDHPLIQAKTRPFIKDSLDHVMHLLELLESNKEMLYSLEELYLSEISFQTNQVMRVLAIVTTLFVPLSFLAGIYGMNFDNIPELHHPNGYYYLLASMLAIVMSLFYYFKKKKWL